MTRRERAWWKTASDMPPKLIKTVPRPVFFLEDHQAGSKEICEAEQTNCQAGSRSRMTAFLGPAQLPSTLLSPACVSNRLSSSSPSNSHDYSMKVRNGFSKTASPGTDIQSTQEENQMVFWIVFHCWSSPESSITFIYTLQLIEIFQAVIISFLPVHTTLIGIRWSDFPRQSNDNKQPDNKSRGVSFHIWGSIFNLLIWFARHVLSKIQQRCTHTCNYTRVSRNCHLPDSPCHAQPNVD